MAILTYIGPNSKNISGKSSKFYQAKVSGSSAIIRHGRTGSEGRFIVKPFNSPALAEAFVRERLSEKRANGYR